MKTYLRLLTVIGLLACGQALALPADHPANPEAGVPVFRPADYFSGPTGGATLAADEHQHDAAPAAEEPGDQDAAMPPKHEEGKGMDMECMKKMHGDGKQESGMHDCPMMEKTMPSEGGQVAPTPKKDEGHESHP